MQRMSKIRPAAGFTLIELMIVVAIIGVLSSVALPQYRNYVVKTKLAEAFYAVTPVKYGLVEYVSVNGVRLGWRGRPGRPFLKS